MATAVKPKKPVILQLLHGNADIAYDLSDEKDWALLYDESILEIKDTTGAAHYWPVSAVTRWIIRERV